MLDHKVIINNVAKETELLESLEWDYERLQALYEFMDIHFSGDSIISPKIFLEEVLKKFGEDCCKVLQTLFVEVSLTNGLFIYDPNIEH